LNHGLKVISYGSPETWPTRSDITFNCKTIEIAGEGELKKQYELLKKKLEKEGLFAEEKKRPIPQYVQRIGVITSGKGEVIYDFRHNLRKFGFKVKICDSRVEGQMAVVDLLETVKVFRKEDIEVLVIIRGGGAIDSLAPMAPFNNETLIREIRNFPVPVITGIGHHRDIPLISLAADRSESTPTAVAHLLNKSWEEALLLLERYEGKIKDYTDSIIHKYETIKNQLMISMQNFKNGLVNIKNNIVAYKQDLFADFRNLLLRVDQNLKNSENVVYANNPERHLKLGYSIARINNKIIKNIDDVSIGDSMNLLLYNGEIISEVKNKKLKDK